MGSRLCGNDTVVLHESENRPLSKKSIPMKPTNTIFILSDEHNKRVLGCYGHSMTHC